jgi:hypothetical protein
LVYHTGGDATLKSSWEAQENLEEHFTVTTDIQVEGLKLKGWAEGDPF